MRAAYVDMIGGASGNMLLGALIDAGADAEAVERALRTIPVGGWSFERRRAVKRGSPSLRRLRAARRRLRDRARWFLTVTI